MNETRAGAESGGVRGGVAMAALSAILSALAVTGLAQLVPPGFDAASVARFGLGGRALAMAGAYVAVAEGAVAGYWNPAGIARMEDLQLEGMYTNWLGADIHLQYVSIAGHPRAGDGRLALKIGERLVGFGLTWTSVQVADIPWSEDDVMGTFDAWSHQGILSVAIPVSVSGGLDVGLNAKVYHDRILEGRSFGVGFDAGLLWKSDVRGVPICFGICMTDIGGSRVQWYGTTGEPVNHVPWIVRTGVSARVTVGEVALLVAGGYEWGLDRPRFERARAGVELSVAWLAVRGGWDQPLTGDPGRWSVGLGVRLSEWGLVEYAFLPGRLGDSHLVALKLIL